MSEPSLLLVPDSKLVRPNGSTTTASTTTAGPPPSGDHYNPLVREVNIPKLANGSCGFDLSRSKWDPYPWVGQFIGGQRQILQMCRFVARRSAHPPLQRSGELAALDDRSLPPSGRRYAIQPLPRRRVIDEPQCQRARLAAERVGQQSLAGLLGHEDRSPN